MKLSARWLKAKGIGLRGDEMAGDPTGAPPARNSTAFRAAERAYRRRDPKAPGAAAAELAARASLIDFGAALRGEGAACASAPLPLGDGCFTLRDYHPGLVVMPGALSADEQAELCALVLRRWAYEQCGRTNLGALQPPRTQEAGPTAAEPAGSSEPAALPPFVRLPPAGLSWVTLGLHYDWSSRSYGTATEEAADTPPARAEGDGGPSPRAPRSSGGGPMPQRLVELCARLAGPGFVPEAAIIKAYSGKAAMLAHVDDAEAATEAPVVSLSLGCEGVFLLGGPRREDAPVLPLLLRSGDGLLLGGKARLCYHALARVYAHTAPRHLQAAPQPPPGAPGAAAGGTGAARAGLSAEECAWLRTHRLNINIRQVRPSP